MPGEGLPAVGAPTEDAGAFDWWAAPEQRAVRHELAEPETDSVIEPVIQSVIQPVAGPVDEFEPDPTPEPEPGLAPGPEPGPVTAPAPVAEAAPASLEPELEPEPGPGPEPLPQESAAAVYRHVQEGEEFQEVRRAYRSFVFPACAAFLAWYLLYIVAAVTLPEVMDRQVAGPFNIAWVLGLLQFASTFLITWLYARHARDRRDRTALGLRWETQDRLR